MKEMYEDLYPLNSNFDITDIIRWWDDKHGLLEGKK